MLVGLALLIVPALAFAGATVTEGTETLKVKAKIDPAKASKKKGGLRPVQLKLDYVAGTTDDSRLPDLRSVSVYTGGIKTSYDSFKKCDESDVLAEGKKACPKGSKVGSGTATAEVHPPDSTTSKQDLKVNVTIYNGRLETDRNGEVTDTVRDGLLFYTEVAGSKIALPFWAEDGNTRVTYYNPADDPTPPSDDALYTIKEVHLTFPRRSVRKNGKRIPYMGAPRECKEGNWTVTATNDRYAGGEIEASHDVKCIKAG
jgi:hypothetical protein